MEDKQDGSYVVTATATKAGKFHVNVHVNGADVQNSPVEITVTEDKPVVVVEKQPEPVVEVPKQESALVTPREDIPAFPRLLRVSGKGQNVSVSLVPLSGASLNSAEVFILDLEHKVIQWNGATSGIFLKNKASTLMRAIDDERSSKVDIHVHSEGIQINLSSYTCHLIIGTYFNAVHQVTPISVNFGKFWAVKLPLPKTMPHLVICPCYLRCLTRAAMLS